MAVEGNDKDGGNDKDLATPVDAAGDFLVKHFKMPRQLITDEMRAIFMQGFNLENNVVNEEAVTAIENDPAKLEALLKQLEMLGLNKIVDRHRASMVIEKPSDEIIAKMNERLTTGKLPTAMYESVCGFTGFDFEIVDGKAQFKKTAVRSFLDWGENKFLRTVNHKVGIDGFRQNVEELGLAKYFSVGEDGVVTEDLTDYAEGFMLDDLLRYRDDESKPYLKQFSSKEAISQAVLMVDGVHRASGRGVGELLGNDIVVTVNKGKITGSRLALPKTTYNVDIDVESQKAWDIIDLTFSTGIAGFQHGGEAEAKQNVASVFENYSDKTVLARVKAMLKMGKPKISGLTKIKYGFDRVQDKAAAEKAVRDAVKVAA